MRTIFEGGVVEKVYPYRTAVVNCLFTVEAETEAERIEMWKFLKVKLRDKMDNHIVFKMKENPLYFWYTDNKIIVGTKIFTNL